MIVGVTGSRTERTPEQMIWFCKKLYHLGATVLHHGDCRGADEQAHDCAIGLGLTVVIHPPIKEIHRAFCYDKTAKSLQGSVTVLEPKDYLLRNRDLVDASEYLLALPEGPETQRSGTWSTIRYAQSIGVPVEVFLP